MLRILSLCIVICTMLHAADLAEELPDKSAYLIKKFEADAAKERAKVEREIAKMRDDLIDDLEKEMKTATKRGNLEEALNIKAAIESLQQEQREQAVDIFGNRVVREPKLKFFPEKSMPLYPDGTQFGPFPRQEGIDPLGVFSGKPIFFDQRTDVDDVIYAVQLPKTVKKMYYTGSAAQNLTIVITDTDGNILGSGGPWGGGNQPLSFEVDFKPAREFVITFSNHVSTWFYISSIKFE